MPLYTVTVYKSDNPTLQGISFTRDVSQTLELTPEFNSNVLNYTATTEYTDWELSIDAGEDVFFDVELNNNPVEVTDYVIPLTLTSGDNRIAIEVTNKYDTTMRVRYIVTITVE